MRYTPLMPVCRLPYHGAHALTAGNRHCLSLEMYTRAAFS